MSRKRLWTRAPQWSGALCKVIARDPVLVWRLGLREGRFGATNGREASIRSGGAPSHAGKVPSSGASDKKRPLHFRGMPHGRGNPRSPRAICNIFALTTARSSLSLSWRMVVSASQNARTCSPSEHTRGAMAPRTRCICAGECESCDPAPTRAVGYAMRGSAA
jgi:hypothetical protein